MGYYYKGAYYRTISILSKEIREDVGKGVDGGPITTKDPNKKKSVKKKSAPKKGKRKVAKGVAKKK